MLLAVQMPEFYERRVTSTSTSLTRQAAATTKRPYAGNTHEESDIFRPPDEAN
jgi:hypothetical protein